MVWLPRAIRVVQIGVSLTLKRGKTSSALGKLFIILNFDVFNRVYLHIQRKNAICTDLAFQKKPEAPTQAT